MRPRPAGATIVRYANMLKAVGAEPRLRIMPLALSSHPTGMVVGSIRKELGLLSAFVRAQKPRA
jgi:ArsR family transcriptional regulator